MWYVIQVRTGTEESICVQCKRSISGEILERCVIPRYEEQKRYLGEWHRMEKILFPGYLFLVSEHLEELYSNLKHIVGMTKLLGAGKEVVPLTQEEIKLLECFGGNGQVVEISKGTIEQSQIHILSGPMKGMEGYIRKLNRHKKKAYLEIPMFGRNLNIQVGLEIVAKC